jgi:5-methylcytosine-specific restriction endonuclease McrA
MPYLPTGKKRVRLKKTWQNKQENSFYTTPAWRKFRINYLKRHPLCIECKKVDITMKATIIDHIVPIREGCDPWDEMNMQPLCYVHHNKKTAREGNRKRWSKNNKQ